MEYEAAPLEGITDAVYRRTHAALYPGITRYYTPFISPTQNHCFTPREMRELAPENNPGLTLVPQLLGKNAQDLLWAMEALADMGYDEVDLNFGCPSGTVTAKRKGAGLLAYPDELEALLDEVFASAPIRVSVKTRLGMDEPEEFFRILAIYDRFPIHRLIIHPRTRSQMYEGAVHMDAFDDALRRTRLPVCYNGDLKTPDDIRGFAAAHPTVSCVMAGRGLIADPALFAKLHEGADDAEKLRVFHERLCEEYVRVFGGKNSAMHRMKAIWAFLLTRFANGQSYQKQLIQAGRWEDFLAVAEMVFSECELKKTV